MLTINNIEDQILSRIFLQVNKPHLVNTIQFHDCGDLYQITIHSLPPTLTESNLWECQSARLDMYCDQRMKEVAHFFNLEIISEFLNMLASKHVFRDEFLNLN